MYIGTPQQIDFAWKPGNVSNKFGKILVKYQTIR